MLGSLVNYFYVFFRNLQGRANSGHPDIKITTAESSLDSSGPTGGCRQDWCGARGLGGEAASGSLWKVEYINIGDTAFVKLWAEIQCNGTFGVCELSTPSLPSHYLRFKHPQPLLIPGQTSLSPFRPACSAPPPCFRDHTGVLLQCLLAPGLLEGFCLVLSHKFPSEKGQV